MVPMWKCCAQPSAKVSDASQNPVRHDGTVIVIHRQPAFQRRHRALRAGVPFADPAGYANRLEGGAGVEVEIICIDEAVCIGNLAAERQRIAWLHRAEAPASLGDLGGETEVAHAIRSLCQLPDDPPRHFESLMHIPERAGGSEPGELKFRCAVTLGDVSGTIHPREEDRDALLPRSLQRAQPVTDLFQTGTELGGEKVQIVTEFTGASQKAFVGQEQGSGEIVLQPDTTDFHRFGCAKTGLAGDAVNGVGGK